MFYVCSLPFLLVEAGKFRAVFLYLNPGVKFPSRHKLVGPLLERAREEYRKMGIDKIKQHRIVTVVTDAWTDTNGSSNINFMVVSLGMKSLFWASVPTGIARHTGEYIAEQLAKVIDEMQARHWRYCHGCYDRQCLQHGQRRGHDRAKTTVFWRWLC